MIQISSPDVVAVLWSNLGLLLGCVTLTFALNPYRNVDRVIFGVLTIVLIGVYVEWRWTSTLPRFAPTPLSLWEYIYFLFEAVAVLYTLLSIVILFRHSDHSTEADEAAAHLEASGDWPEVDVFICTYNEPIDVLEKSVLLAKAMDYPRFRIWVLDDTRRVWLQDYCRELDVGYLTRPTNEWAKAGNLNNGLRLTAGPSAAPLILVLDADFAPHRNFLKRTVGLFQDERIGVVQTPQLYFNADPIQHNLMATKSWVDDQRLFFDVFQPAKDAWDAAFCVGTSFVVRRDRLEDIGGFPYQSISEDLNLSYTLLRHGYVTRWLNERLSVGLAAEGLPEYVTQRARWCLGTIQVALLKEGPIRGPAYTLTQRVHFIHSVLNWLCKPFVLLMLIAPSLYWFFDLPAFQADYVAFLRYAGPALIFFYSFGGWVSHRRTLPIFMEVTHMMTAVAVTRTLISCCYQPFGRPFKVTDKGGDRSRTIVRWDQIRIFGFLLALSIGAIAWAFIGPYAVAEPTPVDRLNLIWAGMSGLLCGIACLICIERPRSHREELFEDARLGQIRSRHGDFEFAIQRLTTFDAVGRIANRKAALTLGATVQLFVETLGELPATVGHRKGRTVTLHLDLPEPTRRSLVVALYSAPNANVPIEADMTKSLLGLLRRGFVRN